MRSSPEPLLDPAHAPGILPFHVRQDTVFINQAGKYNAVLLGFVTALSSSAEWGFPLTGADSVVG